MSQRTLVTVALVAALGAAASGARAQDISDQWAETRNPTSPENFSLEARVGLYAPDAGPAFAEVFGPGGSVTPSLEIDTIVLKVPDVLWFGIGANIGMAGFSAGAYDTAGNRLTETTYLNVVPMAILAVLKVDVLARKLRWPFVFVGKLGVDFDWWNTGTGARQDASGITIGLRWAAQLQFELDFFDRKAARQLDEAWGINHSFLFFELYGVTGNFNSSLNVGTPLDWAAGLGFTF